MERPATPVCTARPTLAATPSGSEAKPDSKSAFTGRSTATQREVRCCSILALPTSQGFGRTKQPCSWRARRAARFSVTVRVIGTSSMNKKGLSNGSVRFSASLPEILIMEEGVRHDTLWFWCTLARDLRGLAGKGSGRIIISCENTHRASIFRLVRRCDFRICRSLEEYFAGDHERDRPGD
jgi:hypothetical protein